MSLPRLKSRAAGGAPPLGALLHSSAFRLGRETARVAQNLALHGGRADEAAVAWIGADLPPLGAPSVTMGSARGTLGPFSFGFLDNTRPDGAAAYAAPLPARPRRGSVALVCARRDALPDVAPLVVARGLGVSWIISTGDGDAEPVLLFLASDPATRAVLLSPSSATRPGAITALGGKPAIVLGGDPLLRAAARRAGGGDAGDLESWFAHGALIEAGAPAPSHPIALVVGGGVALLEGAARAAGLKLPIRTITDDDPDEVAHELAAAAGEGDLVLAVTSEPLVLPPAPTIVIDPGHLERFRALAAAIVSKRAAAAEPTPRLDAEHAQARAILEAAGRALSDHDTKRLLKAWGARVSRQAPANSPTAAARVASQVGLPVDVAAGVVPGERATRRPAVRRAASIAEVRHAAALLLESAPFVLIREAFPEAPRARLAVRREKGLGVLATIEGASEERALLPLERADALLLARRAGADSEKAAADLLLRACAAAVDHGLDLDLEIYLGDTPAVVSASGSRAD